MLSVLQIESVMEHAAMKPTRRVSHFVKETGRRTSSLLLDISHHSRRSSDSTDSSRSVNSNSNITKRVHFDSDENNTVHSYPSAQSLVDDDDNNNNQTELWYTMRECLEFVIEDMTELQLALACHEPIPCIRGLELHLGSPAAQQRSEKLTHYTHDMLQQYRQYRQQQQQQHQQQTKTKLYSLQRLFGPKSTIHSDEDLANYSCHCTKDDKTRAHRIALNDQLEARKIYAEAGTGTVRDSARAVDAKRFDAIQAQSALAGEPVRQSLTASTA